MARKVKPRWRGRQTPSTNARSVLPDLTLRYLQVAGKVLANERPSAKTLHKLRLETKRLRYTLDMFRLSLGSMVNDRIEMLRQLQGYLGDLNDCVTTRELLFGKSRARPPQLGQVWKFLDGRVAAKTADLMRHLRENFQGAAQQEQWTDYRARAGKARSH